MVHFFTQQRDRAVLKTTLAKLPDFQAAILTMIHDRRPPGEIQQQILAFAVNVAQSPRELAFLRIIADATTGRTRNAVTLDTMYAENLINDLTGITGRAISQRQVQVVGDVRRDPAYVPLASGVRSELAVPLIQGANCYGVLNLESPHAGWFTEDDVMWSRQLADLAAMAEDIEVILRSADEVRALTGIDNHGYATKRSLTRILDALVASFTPSAGIMAEVMGVVPHSNQLLTLALSPLESVAIHIRLREGEGTTGTVFQTGRPRVGNISPSGGDITHLLSTRSVLVMPILGPEGQPLGVLNIESNRPNTFSHADIERLHHDNVIAQIAKLLMPLLQGYASNAQIIESLLNDAEAQVFAIIDPDNLEGTFHQFLQIAAQLTEEQNVAGGLLLVKNAQQEIPADTLTEDDRLELTATLGAYKPLRDEWRLGGSSITRVVALQNTSRIIEDAHTDPLWRSVGPGYEHGSEICVPLEIDHVVIGVIDLVSPVHRAFNETDEVNLSRLAKLITHAIKRANDAAAAKRTTRQLQVAIDMQQILAPLYDAGECDITDLRNNVLDFALQVLRAETRADVGYISLALTEEVDHANLAIQGSFGDFIDPNKQRWWTKDGITGRAYRTGRTQVVPFVARDPDYFMSFTGIQSELAVPLKRGAEILGVLDLESREADHFITAHQRWAEFLADRVVQAMVAIDLASETKRDIEIANLSDAMDIQIDRIRQLQLAPVGGNPALREHRNMLLQQALAKTCALTGARNGSVMLSINAYHPDSTLDLENGRLLEVVSWPPDSAPTNPDEFIFSINLGVSGKVFRDEALYVFNDIDERPREFFGDSSTVAELAVPLFEGAKIVGVLNLESDVPDTFMARDVDTGRDVSWIFSDIIVSAKARAEELQRELLRQFEIDILRKQQEDSAALMQQILTAAARLTVLDAGEVTLILARAYPEDGQAVHRVVQQSILTVTSAERYAVLPPRPVSGEFDRDHPVITSKILEDVLAKGESILIPNIASLTLTERYQHDPLWTTGSLLCVPLLRPSGGALSANQEAFGAIVLTSTLPYNFSDLDDQVMALFAQTAVIAMRNNELLGASGELTREMRHIFGKTISPLLEEVQETETLFADLSTSSDPAVAELRKHFDQIAKLILLTNDIIYWFTDLSKEGIAREDAKTPPRQVADLVTYMGQRLDTFAGLMKGRHVYWSLPDMELLIPGSEARWNLINAALFGLVENAVKYSTRDDIFITTGSTATEVLFTVRSTGPQVESHERPLIFEPGVRGMSTARSTIGTGIGLYHVHRIAELLGGQVIYLTPDNEHNDFILKVPRYQGATLPKGNVRNANS